MADIKLFEYESKEIVKVNQATLAKYLDETNIETRKFFRIVYKNKKLALKARQYVGVAQFDDIRITVYPKISYNKNNDNDVNENQFQAMSNFIFMLGYVRKWKNIKHFDSSSDEMKNYDFLEVLIYLFAHTLLDLLKRNMNRAYVVVDDESNFLKGTWRLSEQLSRAPHLKHKFFVSYDEFTENNFLNRVLKFVCGLLIRCSKNSQNITLLKNIRLIFAEVNDIDKPTKAQLEQMKFNRLNQEFEYVYELGKMFILDIIGDYTKSSFRNFTFMFDMNALFEQFIAEFIRREGLNKPDGYEIITQASSKHLCYKNNGKPENLFLLKPDILFKKDKKNVLIIDTKYKLLDDKDQKKLGVSESDAYQMFAYAKKYECKRVVLLYPAHCYKENCEGNYFFDVKNPNDTMLQIRTVNLQRDLRKELGKLRKELENIINN